MLASSDRKAAALAIHKWIMALGPVADCTACVSLSQTELHLKPELDWLGDDEMLGAELSQVLKHGSHTEIWLGETGKILTAQPLVDSSTVGGPIMRHRMNQPVYRT